MNKQAKGLIIQPFFESFDKTFSKVFCDPTATRWSPAHGRNTPQRGPCFSEKEAKFWV
ncbi:MAG: hypothetical protein IJX46_06855 [Clostridia bacterium]|nr:hypothetical protein [Clostridia bacterium]